jgi:hypothetical protein
MLPSAMVVVTAASLILLGWRGRALYGAESRRLCVQIGDQVARVVLGYSERRHTHRRIFLGKRKSGGIADRV